MTILHEHVSEGLEVTESAMLPDRTLGVEREVDVVIRARVGGQEVIVSVEATSTKRPVDVVWVEGRLKKHESLPTSKLVLVSEGGFTQAALRRAELGGAVTLTPEDLERDESGLGGRLPALWAKEMNVVPERLSVVVAHPTLGEARVALQRDHNVYLEDGTYWGSAEDAVRHAVENGWDKLGEAVGLASIGEDLDKNLELDLMPPWVVKIDGVEQRIYLRQEEHDPPELHRIEWGRLNGRLSVKVHKIDLLHKKLPDLGLVYSFGTARLGESDAVVVMTASEGSDDEARGTFRIYRRPSG